MLVHSWIYLNTSICFHKYFPYQQYVFSGVGSQYCCCGWFELFSRSASVVVVIYSSCYCCFCCSGSRHLLFYGWAVKCIKIRKNAFTLDYILPHHFYTDRGKREREIRAAKVILRCGCFLKTWPRDRPQSDATWKTIDDTPSSQSHYSNVTLSIFFRSFWV